MAAFNAEGEGVFSPDERVRTKEGVPSEPPRDVNLEALSSTSLKVLWMPPEPTHLNGVNQVSIFFTLTFYETCLLL